MRRAPLSWVRPAKQARAQETVARFFAALAQVLDEKTFDEASVAEIAKRASSSVGAFYARFQDKDALLQASHAAFVDEAIATAEAGLDPARWQDVPLAEVVAAFASFVVEQSRAQAGVRRAYVAAAYRDRRFRDRAARAAARTSTLLGELFAARRAEHAHEDPARAAEFLHRTTFALLDLHALYGDETPGARALDDEQVKAEIARVACAYLGVKQSAAVADGRGGARPTPSSGRRGRR